MQSNIYRIHDRVIGFATKGNYLSVLGTVIDVRHVFNASLYYSGYDVLHCSIPQALVQFDDGSYKTFRFDDTAIDFV